MTEPLRIALRFRFGLAVKGALLLALALVFVALAGTILLGRSWFWPVRLALAAVFLFPLPVLGPGAISAFLDAIVGRAILVAGAVALPSRRSGWSLRLPDGGFAEYLLWNPWHRLTPGCAYTVAIGARSRVLVAPPSPDQAAKVDRESPPGSA